ncbi:hypothetical protein V1517DRAFT_258341 [Lipomyces orientalis]|uniref:Uncharacterized protein n=1 Tax=Lipomyces orientalis TaxID=1233043 RepID=A0ACC3TT80_9ASCO
MAEFDAAIALLGLVDPKDEKSSDSDSASSNDQEKAENKPSNKENREDKKSRDASGDVVKTEKTDDAKSEPSNPGTASKIMQETDDCKEQDESPNGTNQVTELKASDSPRAHPQGQSHQSGPVLQHEDQTSQQSSQDPSSEWDRRSQEQYVRSPHDSQQPQQSSGQYQQTGQSYQHHQAAGGHQHQQQQQRLPPTHAQYQYSAQQPSPSQSQKSQPQSPPQYSQTQAYSTQQSSSNPPPRLPPISQISQPPTPSHHQPYPEHGPRSGYQDHGSYPPYQQPAAGPPPGSFQHVEQQPPGYAQASPHVQPMYAGGAQGPSGQPPNIASRPSSYYSYRDPNEQYTAAGAPSSAPTPQNGYQHYSAPIDPALGGHSVPPVRPQPEPYPKERYYQPPIQPNGVPPAQRRANTSSNPQGDSNVWNATANSDGESTLNAISVHYINGKNHTHANFATGDFLGAIIYFSIHGCDTGKIICSP